MSVLTVESEVESQLSPYRIGENDLAQRLLWKETEATAVKLEVSTTDFHVVAHLIEELDVYSPTTAAHCMRVGIASGEVGVLIGADSRLSFLGGLAHDIGKLSVPLEVLEKSGAFNNLDRAVMASHSELGYQIARYCGLPAEICDAIGTHHRRQLLNPSGFSDEGLNLSSQLIRDAITIGDYLDAASSRNDGYDSQPCIEHVRFVLDQENYAVFPSREKLGQHVLYCAMAALYELEDRINTEIEATGVKTTAGLVQIEWLRAA